ncbi:MAG: ABC transporter ATP-binding protein [Alphaproteobacteria bacterium]
MFFRLADVSVHYHKVAALKGVSLEVNEGDIVTLIGANGAGKTTTLRAISGLIQPSSGEIWFQDQRIDGLPPEKIVKLGIAHVPEGRRLFPELTVLENLYIGAFLRSDKNGVAGDLEKVFAHFPWLTERQKQYAKTLSGGEQQMLAIGRALMSNPKLLLLDEPSLGLSPAMVQEIATIIREINQRGVPVILVEQNAELALTLARYGYVLETGRVALEGEASDLHEHEHVKKAYLGG